MKKFIALLSLFSSFCIWASNADAQSKIVSPTELKMIEGKVQQELSSKSLDNNKKFYINLLAGRELYQYRFFEKSEKYYLNAIKLETEENKSEAYINLMAISINLKNKIKTKEYLENAKNYFEKNKEFQTKDVEYYLTTVAKYLPNNSKSELDVTGFYGAFASEENLKNLIQNKEYQRAFGVLNPEGVKKANNSLNITTYDTLNVLVNKKSVKELYCNKEYNEFPNAYAYSTLVCGLLNDYLKTGKLSDKKLKRAETYFSKEDPAKKYFLDMVKEIK